MRHTRKTTALATAVALVGSVAVVSSVADADDAPAFEPYRVSQPVSAGASWQWRYDSAAPPADWRTTGFDDSSWRQGNAVLGWGTSVGTDVSVGAPSKRPLAIQFRRDFQIADPAAVATGAISVIANDGVIVFVNGTEVGRTNLPDGEVTANTYAYPAPTATYADANWSVFDVPTKLLRPGRNVVAAETHLNYRATRDVSFDLTYDILETMPPPTPVVAATAQGADRVDLTWTDAEATTATQYQVTRDDAPLATVPVTTRQFSDTSLNAGTTYNYSVVGVDSLGRKSGSGEAQATTADPAGITAAQPVSAGASWQWRYDSAAPPADWRTTGFDDSSWRQGNAVLGWGTSVGTDVSVGAPSKRPLAIQFRRDFQIADPAAVATGAISVIANDGVIVFVNGTEVGRTNLPDGEVTANTYAYPAPTATYADANWSVFDVPTKLLRPGRNVVAAETHLNYRATRDVSFDLTYDTIVSEPLAAPEISGQSTGQTTAELSWSDAPDSIAAQYRLSRDGTVVATVPAGQAPYTYSDSGLQPATTYEYSVVGISASGQVSPAGVVSVATSAEAPVAPVAPGSLEYWGAPVWSDEFEGSAIDPARWNVRSRSDLGLLPDAAVPDAGQVSVSGGVAHLRADWLDEPVDQTYGTAPRWHKVGYMDTRPLKAGNTAFAQRYGRWEIRAKVPTAPGTSLGVLPAFWLRNSDKGEIDIFEAWGSGPASTIVNQWFRPGTFTTTVHTDTTGTNNVKKEWNLSAEEGRTSPVSNDFHTWAVEYTPTDFRLYYDGRLLGSATPQDTPQLWGPSFQSPLHMRLNVHVGMAPTFMGLPDPNHREYTSNIDMQVDYVRVYAMPS